MNAAPRTHPPETGLTRADRRAGIARMEAAPAPAKRITVGGVLNETFSIYGQHAQGLLGSAIVILVIVGVAAGLLQNEVG